MATTVNSTPKIADVLGPGKLKFGKTGDIREFQSAVTKCEFTPDLKMDNPVPLLDGSDFQPEGEWGGTISGDFYQEYGLNSLIAWCFDHAGEIIEFEYMPNETGKLSWTGKCRISPVKVGGDPKKNNTTAFSFTLVGRPEMKKVTA